MCKPFSHAAASPCLAAHRRAPQIFRKQIVSVDLLSDSDEKTLQTITACFGQDGGGVPELGLGNAEVVVQYEAWSLVMSLARNGQWYQVR